jgi:hypothetical protein
MFKKQPRHQSFAIIATAMLLALLTSAIELSANPGKIEFEVFTGKWTVGPILQIYKDRTWQTPVERDYGFAVRFKPALSFSIGLVIQRVEAKYKYTYSYIDKNAYMDWTGSYYNRQLVYYDARVDEEEKMSFPMNMVLIDVRWEIKPTWRIHPYISLGLGAMQHKIIDTYKELRYKLDHNGDILYSELAADGPGDIKGLPSVLPVFEFLFGLKGELWRQKLAIGIEGGIVNGLILRGTLSFRI